jgi:hypothetical protein
MAVHTVSDEIINSPAAKDYFSSADKRIMIGLRAALEMLSIPVPQYAVRRPPGRPPSRAVASAYRADHPETQHSVAGVSTANDPLGDRRLSAAVTKAKARIARQRDATGSLYDDTFNG